MHNLSYGILSTSSSVYWQPFNTGVAFGNPQPFVDGTVDEPTGNIYLYVSDDDASMQDVATNAEASFTLSEEFAGNNCSHADVDSKQPLCMRVVLVGSMQNVSKDDRTWASSALFERHPAMKKWTQQGHAFHVLTMKLKTVWMIDSFGGAVTVTPADYFAAKGRRACRYCSVGQPGEPNSKQQTGGGKASSGHELRARAIRAGRRNSSASASRALCSINQRKGATFAIR